MKKTLRTLLCLLMALSVVLCLAACDLSGDSNDDDEDEESITGTYYFYEMTDGDETYTVEDLEAELEAYAEYYGEDMDIKEFFYLELNKNGTGTLCYMGEEMDMEWDEDAIWPEDDKDNALEYKVSGSKITLENEGATMVLKK